MTTPTPTPAADTEVRLHRNLLEPHPNQPRKRFRAAPLEELRANIAEQGVLQSLLVRPNPFFEQGNGRPPYQIVAGERRWRASDGVLDELPCRVRSMDDQAVAEAQLSENGPREPLHPLEEAEAFEQLLLEPPPWLRHLHAPRERGYTIDALARRLGREPRLVKARLELLTLTPAARSAFFDEAFAVGSARQIARLNTQHQEELVQAIAHDRTKGAPWSADAISQAIQARYMLRLALAPFDQADAQLVPDAGPCTTCHKRSGANPELFDDITDGDTCADRACFANKCAVHEAAAVERAHAAGRAVITGKEAERLLPKADGTVPGYLRLDRPSDMALSNKPLAEVLGDDAPQVALIVRSWPEGTPSTLVEVSPTLAVRAVLKDKGLLKPEPQKPDKPAAKASAPAPAPKPREPKPEPSASDQVAAAVAATEPAADTEPPLTPEVQQLVDKVSVIPSHVKKGAKPSKKELDRWRASALDSVRGALAAGAVGATVAGDGAYGLPSEGLNRLLLDYALCSSALRVEDVAALAGLPAPDGSKRHPGDWPWLLTEEQAARALLVTLAAGDSYIARDNPERDPGLITCAALDIDVAPLYQRAERIVAAKLARQLEKLQPAAAKPAAPKKPAAPIKAPARKPVAKKQPVKYRNPATGETWSGRGLQPKWLKVALAAGKKLTDFDVAATTPPAAKATLSPAAAWPFPGRFTPAELALAREHIVVAGATVTNIYVQRSIGCSMQAAEKILHQLEQDKVVGPADSTGHRQVLIAKEGAAT